MKSVPEHSKQDKFWINAWYDPLASIPCFHGGMCFVDVAGDGNNKLIILQMKDNPLSKNEQLSGQNRMKVYKGTIVISENILLDEPVAVCSFFSDLKQPRRPFIAVACGCFVYLYKNLLPFFRFSIPSVEIDSDEKGLWETAKNSESSVNGIKEQLEKFRREGKILSPRAMDYLKLETKEEMANFLNERRDIPLNYPTFSTCMTVLKKEKSESDSIGMLIVGTENQMVYILDSTGANIKKEFKLPATPVFLSPFGLFDVEYRLYIACRNGNVYCITSGELSGIILELESIPCALTLVDKNIAVATIQHALHMFTPKGQKLFSLFFPCSVKAIDSIDIKGSKVTSLLIVALENQELRVYNGKTLLNVIQTPDIVTGMKLGCYGTESNAIALSYRNGGLEFKYIARKAKLEENNDSGPPVEQSQPLKLPKKTRLYLEHVEREKQSAVDIHRVFQRELCKMRVTSSRTYLKMITNGKSVASCTSGSTVRLTCGIQGMGPFFRLRIRLQNSGSKALYNVPVILTFDPEIYTVSSSNFVIPVLLPNLHVTSSVAVAAKDSSVGGDTLTIHVCNSQQQQLMGSAAPMLTAIVNMPLVDL